MTIRVSFACNSHRNGAFLGTFEAVEFDDETGDTLVSLSGPQVTIRWIGDARAVRIGNQLYQCSRYATFVGNWCWDAATFELEDARNLLRALLDLGFSKDEWALEGPLVDLVEAS